MKRINIFCMCVIIIAMAGAYKAYSAEFSADVIQSQGGMVINGKVFVKEQRSRMEMEQMGMKSIMLVDLDKGKGFMLQPEEKTYMELPEELAIQKMGQSPEMQEQELAKIADKKLIGEEKIEGYVCDKYEIIYHDKNYGKMTQWMSKKLGIPLKVEHQGPYGVMLMEYKNIKEGGIGDNLFDIPQGYKKVEMPQLPIPMDVGK